MTPDPLQAQVSEGERRASEWLKENDWDYQKYGDRRQDRSAYDGRMNYEISDLLEWAFISGWRARGEADAKVASGEMLFGALELTAWMGLPEKKRQQQSKALCDNVADRIRSLDAPDFGGGG